MQGADVLDLQVHDDPARGGAETGRHGGVITLQDRQFALAKTQAHVPLALEGDLEAEDCGVELGRGGHILAHQYGIDGGRHCYSPYIQSVCKRENTYTVHVKEGFMARASAEDAARTARAVLAAASEGFPATGFAARTLNAVAAAPGATRGAVQR